MELPFTLARRLGSQTSEDLAYNTPSKMMHNTVSCLTKYLQDAVSICDWRPPDIFATVNVFACAFGWLYVS